MSDNDKTSERCSMGSAGIDEIAAGTAARATCWVMLEQPGAWGRKAVTQSDLDPELGARIDALVSSVGGRFGLIREPNKRVSESDDKRVLLIAGGLSGEPWLVRGTVTDPAKLERLTPEALTSPTPDAVLALFYRFVVSREAVALVCTNGTRDLCCALEGRPVAIEAAQQRGGLVFETSHTGGHRFAPTGVLLPSGFTFARASAERVVAAIDAGSMGIIAPDLNDTWHNRGMSALPPEQQVALATVQEQLGVARLTGWQLTTLSAEADRWQIRVRREDTDELVEVIRDTAAGETRPLSCGAEAKLLARWRATII
ncbi:hypothetical protein SAMN02910418_00706 [Bowdeniella nasicola]|uniref:Sucrase ferredoxin n=1 Tax=Bowdeniella nasicola TaxID=208480 RepID=A0A1H3XQF9_9ACTO|nr:sucrase ferredoxin [Bowdeniella nasicola]SEA01470.1 hypothetical protein SAMN02910418_00706 [Bowdeniella nasicola]